MKDNSNMSSSSSVEDNSVALTEFSSSVQLNPVSSSRIRKVDPPSRFDPPPRSHFEKTRDRDSDSLTKVSALTPNSSPTFNHMIPLERVYESAQSLGEEAEELVRATFSKSMAIFCTEQSHVLCEADDGSNSVINKRDPSMLRPFDAVLREEETYDEIDYRGRRIDDEDSTKGMQCARSGRQNMDDILQSSLKHRCSDHFVHDTQPNFLKYRATSESAKKLNTDHHRDSTERTLGNLVAKAKATLPPQFPSSDRRQEIVDFSAKGERYSYGTTRPPKSPKREILAPQRMGSMRFANNERKIVVVAESSNACPTSPRSILVTHPTGSVTFEENNDAGADEQAQRDLTSPTTILLTDPVHCEEISPKNKLSSLNCFRKHVVKKSPSSSSFASPHKSVQGHGKHHKHTSEKSCSRKNCVSWMLQNPNKRDETKTKAEGPRVMSFEEPRLQGIPSVVIPGAFNDASTVSCSDLDNTSASSTVWSSLEPSKYESTEAFTRMPSPYEHDNMNMIPNFFENLHLWSNEAQQEL